MKPRFCDDGEASRPAASGRVFRQRCALAAAAVVSLFAVCLTASFHWQAR